MKDREVQFEIKKQICTLNPDAPDAWTLELNIVAWNGGAPKWDIRHWNDDHTRMGRGLTFTDDEMATLVGAYYDTSDDEDIQELLNK